MKLCVSIKVVQEVKCTCQKNRLSVAIRFGAVAALAVAIFAPFRYIKAVQGIP